MSFQRPANKGLSVREMSDYFMKWCAVLSVVGIVFVVMFTFSSDLERPFMREIAIVFIIATSAWVLAMVVSLIWYAVDAYARRGWPRPLFPVPNRYRST